MCEGSRKTRKNKVVYQCLPLSLSVSKKIPATRCVCVYHGGAVCLVYSRSQTAGNNGNGTTYSHLEPWRVGEFDRSAARKEIKKAKKSLERLVIARHGPRDPPLPFPCLPPSTYRRWVAFCISPSVAFYRSAYIWISRGPCVFLWFELEPMWTPQITEYAARLRFQSNMQSGSKQSGSKQQQGPKEKGKMTAGRIRFGWIA
ncbi:hypothetical protein PG999_006858 [Apiospora kogelbergensis]|uniref:Uncharacterized protein n=1 Tax=Apiospora kogelbergensis TaxID=1337665 RepID=A0AAW0QWQ3_9PEZI